MCWVPEVRRGAADIEVHLVLAAEEILVEVLSCSKRPWEFAGMGFRIMAVIFVEAPISASDGPICLFVHGQFCMSRCRRSRRGTRPCWAAGCPRRA